MNMKSVKYLIIILGLMVCLSSANAGAEQADVSLKQWQGEYISMHPFWDRPIADPVYQDVSQVSREKGKEKSVLDVKRSIQNMYFTHFDRMVVTEDGITFYAHDNAFVPVKASYEFKGIQEIDFKGHKVKWYTFESTGSNPATAEYQYLIATEIHSHNDGPKHWHMRYGSSSLKDIIENPQLQFWWPTMVAPDYNFEAHVKGLNPKMLAKYLP